VAGTTFKLTASGNLTLIVSGAFLFSGLMFGPDLDLLSRPYKRWGYLRWIWIPYQKMLRHRSILSHGPIIGTALRLLYLAIWLGILGIFLLGTAQLVWDVRWSWQLLAQAVKASVAQYTSEWLAVCIGLELGAMSHCLSDWFGSTYKRINRPHGKMKKRKSSSGASRLRR